MAFVEDSLLRANGLTHHGEHVTEDEELTPTLENFVILTWLRLIHPSLPRLVKQRYSTELRSRTLVSIKPEISQALSSLLEEIHAPDDAKILRTKVADDFRRPCPGGRGDPKIQECIGESRTVNPSYTFDVARVASSSSSQSDSTAECDDNGDELEDDESGNSLEEAKNGNKRVRKRKSHSSAAEMLTFLQSYSEKREKVEEEKISLQREMQKEKKELFGQLLDVLKKK